MFCKTVVLTILEEDIIMEHLDGCCTKLNIRYFILYLFKVINDSVFNLMMLI